MTLWLLDAVGCSTAALFATGNSGMAAIAAAAAYPQRVAALALVHCYARLARAPDYPFGFPESDQPLHHHSGRHCRYHHSNSHGRRDIHGSKPGRRCGLSEVVGTSRAAGRKTDVGAELLPFPKAVRALLPAVHRTLVVQRMGNRLVRVEHAEYLADQMSDARLVQLPGDDHLPYAGDRDAIADEIEEFLTGARRARDPVRVLSTIVFSDIVGSTERVVEMGDRHWRELLDTHDEVMQSLVTRFGGRTIKSTGDGFVAVFDGPARAVKCGSRHAGGGPQSGPATRIGIPPVKSNSGDRTLAVSRFTPPPAPGHAAARRGPRVTHGRRPGRRPGLVFEARGEHSRLFPERGSSSARNRDSGPPRRRLPVPPRRWKNHTRATMRS
jgi:hypothetical protein